MWMDAISSSDQAEPVGLSKFEEWQKQGADVRRELLSQKRELMADREKIDRQLKAIERALSRIPEEPKTYEELEGELGVVAHPEWELEPFEANESTEALRKAKEALSDHLKRSASTDVCRFILKRFPTGLSAAAVVAKVYEVRPDIDKRNVYSYLSRSPHVKRVGERGSLLYYPKGAAK